MLGGCAENSAPTHGADQGGMSVGALWDEAMNVSHEQPFYLSLSLFPEAE